METKDPNNNNEEISLESVQCLPLELEDLYKLILNLLMKQQLHLMLVRIYFYKD